MAGSPRPPAGLPPRLPPPACGPGHPDHALRSACSAPGSPAPGRQSTRNPAPTQKPLGHPARPASRQTRVRRLRTFCRLRSSFLNARVAAAANAAPRFHLATRPAGPQPGRGWRTKGHRNQGSRG